MDLRDIFFTLVLIGLITIITVLVIFNTIVAKNKSGFTELYLVGDPPKTIKTNEEYKFSFAIHNLENKEMAYNYTVYITPEKIKEGHVTLNHTQTAIIRPSFIIEKPEASIPISVQLINKNQEIHFWVDVE